MAHWKKGKASVAGLERAKGRVAGDEVKEETGATSCSALKATVRPVVPMHPLMLACIL